MKKKGDGYKSATPSLESKKKNKKNKWRPEDRALCEDSGVLSSVCLTLTTRLSTFALKKKKTAKKKKKKHHTVILLLDVVLSQQLSRRKQCDDDHM